MPDSLFTGDLSFDNEILRNGLLVLGLVVAVLVIVRVAVRIAQRFVSDPARIYRTNRIIRRTGFLITLAVLAGFFFPRIGDLFTILTVVGAGLAIAMRESLLSIAGRMFISISNPFKHGDRIEINGVRGDVVDIRLMVTTVMEIGDWVDADQSTGRLAHIPNGWIFLHAAKNYSRGFNFIWNELALTVSFRSDWKAAREIMQAFADESAEMVKYQARRQLHQLTREYLIHYSILTPFVYVRIVDNGIRLTLRYLCEVRKRRGTEHAITVSLLDAFRERGDIELAYPMTGLARFDGPQFGEGPTASPPEGPTPLI